MIELATGDVGELERAHRDSDNHYLTCPERGFSCPYGVEPNRPDDFDLVWLLDHPNCVGCGCSLVVVGRDEYGGPEPEFRDLDREGSPLVDPI